MKKTSGNSWKLLETMERLSNIYKELANIIVGFLSLKESINLLIASKSCYFKFIKYVVRKHIYFDRLVTDQVIMSLEYIVPYCYFIDFSRCANITGECFQNIGQCRSIIANYSVSTGFEYLAQCSFIDVSFTSITDSDVFWFSNCKELILKQCVNITDIGLTYLQNCITINLSGCYNITDKGLRHLTNCTSIDLSGCYNITDKGLRHLTNCNIIILSCPQVNGSGFIHLTRCVEISLTGCSIISENLKYLRCKKVTPHSNITNKGLKYLRHCNILSISCCNNITDEGLRYLSNCEYVNISACDRITDEGLQYLTNCKYVDIKCCDNITRIGVMTFYKSSRSDIHCRRVLRF